MEEDGCQLSCVLRLILELTRLSTAMTDQEFTLLSAAVSPVVHLSMEQVVVVVVSLSLFDFRIYMFSL